MLEKGSSALFLVFTFVATFRIRSEANLHDNLASDYGGKIKIGRGNYAQGELLHCICNKQRCSSL